MSALLLLVLPIGCDDARAIAFRPIAATPGACPVGLVGFAAVAGGTSGGAAGARVTVSTVEDLREAVMRAEPLIVALTNNVTLVGQVAVASNKTIVGVGADAGLTGGGFDLTDSRNVIIQNLTIARAAGTDAITLTRSQNVWIDHCDLSSDREADKSVYDGLIDVVHASDNVTVSWSRLHDHRDATLVGHDRENGDEDRGHLTVTYHHNWFSRVTGAAPRVRFGTAHVFNNHYADIEGYAVASVMGATTRIERNVFDRVELPITTSYVDPDPGQAADIENAYSGGGGNQIGAMTTWVPPYGYVADPVDGLPALIAACAGTGRL